MSLSRSAWAGVSPGWNCGILAPGKNRPAHLVGGDRGDAGSPDVLRLDLDLEPARIGEDQVVARELDVDRMHDKPVALRRGQVPRVRKRPVNVFLPGLRNSVLVQRLTVGSQPPPR